MKEIKNWHFFFFWYATNVLFTGKRYERGEGRTQTGSAKIARL